MNRNETSGDDGIALTSDLSEIARIPAWLENLAARDGIPERTRFGMDLCLEEVVSNIIRHGYAGAPHHSIFVRYSKPQSDTFTFVIEDEAPPFNPLHAQVLPPPRSLEESSNGGQGIHLVKTFAHSVNYEPRTTGNRLTLSFVATEFTGSAP